MVANAASAKFVKVLILDSSKTKGFVDPPQSKIHATRAWPSVGTVGANCRWAMQCGEPEMKILFTALAILIASTQVACAPLVAGAAVGVAAERERQENKEEDRERQRDRD
jgi:hypothetical protein